jgi:hypothetical protein
VEHAAGETGDMDAALRAMEENMTDANLNDVFEDNDTTESEAKEVAAKDETEVKDEVAEEVTGEEAETPAAKEEDESGHIPKKALIDERRKRQALEAEVAELKKGKPEEEVEPDLGTSLLRERINLSRELMLETKPDYEEMETVFLDMAKENPSLVTEMNKSPNPAKFAYTKAKEHTEYQVFQKSKDSPEYKEFLDWKKSQGEKPKEEDKRKKSAVKVPDLTKAAAKGSNSEEVEPKPSLEDALEGAPF